MLQRAGGKPIRVASKSVRVRSIIEAVRMVPMGLSSWKIGSAACSLWTFASELQRIFLFGCHKNAATLDTILPPDVFAGVGVSDDAYANTKAGLPAPNATVPVFASCASLSRVRKRFGTETGRTAPDVLLGTMPQQPRGVR